MPEAYYRLNTIEGSAKNSRLHTPLQNTWSEGTKNSGLPVRHRIHWKTSGVKEAKPGDTSKGSKNIRGVKIAKPGDHQ